MIGLVFVRMPKNTREGWQIKDAVSERQAKGGLARLKAAGHANESDRKTSLAWTKKIRNVGNESSSLSSSYVASLRTERRSSRQKPAPPCLVVLLLTLPSSHSYIGLVPLTKPPATHNRSLPNTQDYSTAKKKRFSAQPGMARACHGANAEGHHVNNNDTEQIMQDFPFPSPCTTNQQTNKQTNKQTPQHQGTEALSLSLSSPSRSLNHSPFFDSLLI